MNWLKWLFEILKCVRQQENADEKKEEKFKRIETEVPIPSVVTFQNFP